MTDVLTREQYENLVRISRSHPKPEGRLAYLIADHFRTLALQAEATKAER